MLTLCGHRAAEKENAELKRTLLEMQEEENRCVASTLELESMLLLKTFSCTEMYFFRRTNCAGGNKGLPQRPVAGCGCQEQKAAGGGETGRGAHAAVWNLLSQRPTYFWIYYLAHSTHLASLASPLASSAAGEHAGTVVARGQGSQP